MIIKLFKHMPNIPLNMNPKVIKAQTDLALIAVHSPLAANLVGRLIPERCKPQPLRIRFTSDAMARSDETLISIWLRMFASLSPDASLDELRECLKNAPPERVREIIQLNEMIRRNECARALNTPAPPVDVCKGLVTLAPVVAPHPFESAGALLQRPQ